MGIRGHQRHVLATTSRSTTIVGPEELLGRHRSGYDRPCQQRIGQQALVLLQGRTAGTTPGPDAGFTPRPDRWALLLGFGVVVSIPVADEPPVSDVEFGDLKHGLAGAVALDGVSSALARLMDVIE